MSKRLLTLNGLLVVACVILASYVAWEVMTPAPQRWHIYVVALDPRVGTKPGKQRPCLAIQPTVSNPSSARFCCWPSTSAAADPFRPRTSVTTNE